MLVDIYGVAAVVALVMVLANLALMTMTRRP